MSYFQLPPGYKVWCHICAKPPFNKVTKVHVPENPSLPKGKQVIKDIPGVGLKTWEEYYKHKGAFHDYRK